MADHGQQGKGEHHARDVAVPAGPGRERVDVIAVTGLNASGVRSPADAREAIEGWESHHNEDRPHPAPGGARSRAFANQTIATHGFALALDQKDGRTRMFKIHARWQPAAIYADAGVRLQPPIANDILNNSMPSEGEISSLAASQLCASL